MRCDGLWNFATVSFPCCLFDPSSVYSDGDDPVVEGGYVDGDPMFCEPSLCSDRTSRADYSLHEDSPCTAENSPCGEQIGAFGVGCGVASIDLVTAARQRGITCTSAMPARDALRFRLGPAAVGGPTDGVAADVVRAKILTLGGRRVAAGTFHPAQSGSEIEWRPEVDGVGMASGVCFRRAVRGDGSSAAAKFVWLD